MYLLLKFQNKAHHLKLEEGLKQQAACKFNKLELPATQYKHLC